MATKKSFKTPRATNRSWTLQYGLVQVPISLSKYYSDSGKLESHRVCPEHNERIQQPAMCPHGDGHRVEQAEKEYVLDGNRVKLAPAEEAALPLEHDGFIELASCVPLENINPSRYEGTCMAWPQHDGAREGYTTLVRYLRDNHAALIGVGTYYGNTKTFVVWWDTENRVLAVSTCNYQTYLKSDIYSLSDSELEVEVRPEVASMATAVFGQMPREFDWAAVQDEVAARKRAVIEQKIATGEVVVPEPQPDPLEAEDLQIALRRMLEEIPLPA